MAFSFSKQNGEPGHCLVAQVWGHNGECVAMIEADDDTEFANGYASLFSAAPDLLSYAEMEEIYTNGTEDDLIQFGWDRSKGRAPEWLDSIRRKAIAKARGK